MESVAASRQSDQVKFLIEKGTRKQVDRIQEIEFSGVVEHAAVEEKLAGFVDEGVDAFHGFAAIDVQQQVRILTVKFVENGE